MAQLTKSTTAGGHWYRADGLPCHSVPYSGKREGERATTLADARKLGLFPSVTGVMNAMASPQLEKWKIGQILQHAAKNPWSEMDEPLEYWMKRIRDGAFVKNVEVMDLGSRIHSALETQQVPDDLKPFVEPVFEKVKEAGIEILSQEKVLVNHAEGYAGRTDAIIRRGDKYGILDYKSKATKKEDKIVAYINHSMQLAAYSAVEHGVLSLPDSVLVNVFVSTTEPGRVEIVEHTNQYEAYETFLHVCALWRAMHNYDPRQKQ